mmetsp:Transcript_18252/g.25956  ORF Transcript_18252/g.25956 Transcript_18252/m.25956 type:complete len:387 (+) Transcript_18252:35-1195(+)
MAYFDPNHHNRTYTVIFAMLAALFLLTAAVTVKITHAQSHYKQSIVLAYLFPLCSVILAIITTMLSISYTNYVFQLPGQIFINLLQPFAVPILLDVLYETCYLVHKRRSVNFFGLEFDQGHRVKILNSRTRSFVLRNFIRAIALCLLAIGILSNMELLSSTTTKDYTEGWMGLYPWVGQIWLLISLTPYFCLFVIGFYLSILLWRYGTSYSMNVHSSMCNPWCAQFFGNIAFGIGLAFSSSDLFLITSHVGFLLLIWSVLAVMREISKDLLADEEFEDFLKEVARLGNQYSITNIVKQPPQQAAVVEETKEEISEVDAVAAAAGEATPVRRIGNNSAAAIASETLSVSPLVSDCEDGSIVVKLEDVAEALSLEIDDQSLVDTRRTI